MSVSIPLCVGWNLIGFPSSTARPVVSALASIQGHYLRVFGFDPSDAADPWEVFDPAVPTWANDLTTLEPGRGYWIYATEPTTLVVDNGGDGPTVAIAQPAELATITAPTGVIGTVRSPSLASWRLETRPEGEATWKTLATGSAPVEAATLGTFDPTLLENGLHELRLTGIDTHGVVDEAAVDVLVDGQMKIGPFSLTFVDLEVPLAGLPIQVLRSYDSRRRERVGDFGFGWAMEVRQGSLAHNRPVGEAWQIAAGFLPCQQSLELSPHLTTVRLSDREVYRFRPVLSALAVTGGGCFATVGYAFVDGPVPGATLAIAGNRSVFYGNGTTELVDADALTLYDPTTVRLTTRDGRSFELTRGVGVTKLTDPHGNTVTFTAGAITHSSGVSIALTRDAAGRIVRLADPAGAEVLYAYDAAGDLAAVTDRTAATARFGYLGGHYLETIEDPLGRTPIRNEYGPDGRLTRHVDAFGHTIAYDHRLSDRREVVTNRLGASRLLEYDARGNVTREVDESGVVTVRTFDAHDQLLSESVGDLPPSVHVYDAARNLTETRDGLGHATRFTYDARGNVLTTTDPRGGVTTNVYDSRGNLLQTVDPLGGTRHFTYDARGNLLTETDALGQVSSFAYDGRGNLTRETDALGHATTSTHDSQGNRLSETRTRTRSDGTVETLTTQSAYDANGQLLSTTAPDGSVTRSEYNALGQVTATVDALGRRTGLSYDALGRPTRTDPPDGTFEETAYDAEGRRTQSRDRGGRTTGYEYDAAGRLRRTTFADGAVAEQTYDAAGRLATTRDARGAVATFGYDAAGRRTSVTDALGQVTRTGYDAAGNATTQTDALGATTLAVYDAAGRAVRTVWVDGTSRQSGYDVLGRRTTETDESGRLTRFDYDALGRLTSVTDALDQVTAYAYDELGNRISQTDANGHVTRFAYDALGRQTTRALPAVAGVAVEERFAYDAVGERTSRTDFAGRTTTYAYDLAGRLTRRTYPDGSIHAFGYTATGRRQSMSDARGTTSYVYDARDRLTSLTYPDGRELHFGYDLGGNRTRLEAHVAGQTLVTSFTYDLLSRLETVTDPDGKVSVHGYDANGNRSQLAQPNGVTTSYLYDRRNRLTSLAATHAISGTIGSYAYTLTPTGNRTRIVEADGTTRSYGYDALERLTDEHVTAGSTPGSPTRWRNVFTYDAVGNRLHQDRTTGAGSPLPLAYTYDARDRLLTENALAYGWDAHGNQTSKSGPDGATYDWDLENRLTRVALANGTLVEHTYDADGTRVRTRTTPATGPPTTIDYLVDPWHQTSAAGRGLVLSQVVAETDGTGNLTAYHVRGDDLLATLRPNPAPTPGGSLWMARYFHAEGIGTIRALTDELGNVTDRYTLEAFGTLIDHEGDDPNGYLFAGEALDPNSGLVLQPGTVAGPAVGRFGSMDPWRGTHFEPSTLHRYQYAAQTRSTKEIQVGLMACRPK